MSIIERLQELGHVLSTYGDREDADDHTDTEVDKFAYSNNYHNGPECKLCGTCWCMHCDELEDLLPCDGEKHATVASNNKLSPITRFEQERGE